MLTTSHKIGKISGSLTFLYKSEFEDLSGVPTATYIYMPVMQKSLKISKNISKAKFLFCCYWKITMDPNFLTVQIWPWFCYWVGSVPYRSKIGECYSLIFNHTYISNLFWAIKNTSFENDFHMQIREENISWIFDE